MGLFDWLRGRWRDDSPAGNWLARRVKAEPETVIQEHFAAINAHDLEWILATLSPERGRLYSSPTTMDKKRLSVKEAQVLTVEPAADAPVVRVPGYGEQRAWRVEYVLELASELRDPTLVDGRQWSYYLLVRERVGKPWMIADWGR